jgi:hypothetical protein
MVGSAIQPVAKPIEFKYIFSISVVDCIYISIFSINQVVKSLTSCLQTDLRGSLLIAAIVPISLTEKLADCIMSQIVEYVNPSAGKNTIGLREPGRALAQVSQL